MVRGGDRVGDVIGEGLGHVIGDPGDCPAGEATRELLDVSLGVAVVDPETVQFEDFPGVVLVRLASEVQDVVEIDQHRRAGGAVEEKITEVT